MSARRRRKSLTIFRSDVAPLTPINEPPDSAPAAGQLRKRRPMTFSSSPLSSPISSDMPPSSPLTPIKRTDSQSSTSRLLGKSRPRSLQKSGRPSSIFGSLRNSLHFSAEDDTPLARTTSSPGSVHSTTSGVSPNYGSTVLHHGEIQTAGGMWRKKSQYFVLTDTHLVRFKSQDRASDIFPTIPSSLGRSAGIRHSRVSSTGSLHELHTTTSGESHHAIPLHNIISVWRLEDGKPYFSIEINHLDEDTNYAGAITLQLYDPLENSVWTSSIRAAVTRARLAHPQPFSQELVEYTARIVEHERDYDPNSFNMFKVIHRTGKSGVSKASTEDLTKVQSSVCILAFGVFKVHLVPFPKSIKTASNSSLSELGSTSYGAMTLTNLNVHDTDDAFSISFRLPFRQSTTLFLASSLVSDIALTIRHTTDFLRPNWAESPMTWAVPSSLEEEIWDISPPNEPYQGYDRTLAAYCAAYNIDAARIQYAVHDECEDLPVWELLPPAHGRNQYKPLELLAIMRSLRYNESFATVSFRNISLDVLHSLRDHYGTDHVPETTKSGQFMNIPDQENSTLLMQEITALAVKCRRIRRMDFSYCLTRTVVEGDDNVLDPGCGICEALFPLCAKQWTNVDWIILNGIQLTDVDIDYLFSAAIDRSCHFRALDVGYCGLLERSMHTILQAISHQAGTMESINLSGNLARQDPKEIHDHVKKLEFVRQINLSNISRTSGPEPLISAEVLHTWKLVELRLSRTALNEKSVDALAHYLMSEKSDYVRLLLLDRCQITSREACLLLNAIARRPRTTRKMHIDLSANRLEYGHEALVDAIGRSCSPVRLTMRSMEYKDEKNFQKLIKAFSKNTTTKSLDISKLSLPSDAGDDTCEILHRLFTENGVLEEIDISGEHTHIEAAQYGNGLNYALSGLKKNKTLKVLRVEHQKLGLQGASTLASVLEENTTLREIHCENNEINLQAFTVLVNSMERNTTLLYLSLMEMDRAWSQKKVDKEIDSISKDHSTPSPVTRMTSSTKATVHRTFGRTIGRTLGSQKAFTARRNDVHHSPAPGYTETDFKAAMGSLSQTWDKEMMRLQGFLSRNYTILNGPASDGEPPNGQYWLAPNRPSTGDSLATAIKKVSIDDRTPTAEVNGQLGQDNEAGRERKEAEVDDMDAGVDDAYDSEGDALEMSKQ